MLCITKEKIYQIGKYLQINKASGLDQISNEILRVIIPDISSYPEMIFNDFFLIDYYPAHFKESIIIILCKREDNKDFFSPESY